MKEHAGSDPALTQGASSAFTSRRKETTAVAGTREQFRRPANGIDHGGKPRKEDLVGALLVVTMKRYDPVSATKYGKQAMAEFDLLVVDGSRAGYAETARREFGNLAVQIGRGLQPGDRGVGRYISGEGTQGRRWFGMEWSEDDADYNAAEAALGPDSA